MEKNNTEILETKKISNDVPKKKHVGAEFYSQGGIGVSVKFYPMMRHINKYSLADDIDLTGTITAVKFTKEKVFYSIVDNYFGILFDDVDSVKVEGLEE